MAPDPQRKAELEEFKRKADAVRLELPELEALAARLPKEADRTAPVQERTTPSLASLIPQAPPPPEEPPREGKGRLWLVAVVLALLAAAYFIRNTAFLH